MTHDLWSSTSRRMSSPWQRCEGGSMHASTKGCMQSNTTRDTIVSSLSRPVDVLNQCSDQLRDDSSHHPVTASACRNRLSNTYALAFSATCTSLLRSRASIAWKMVSSLSHPSCAQSFLPAWCYTVWKYLQSNLFDTHICQQYQGLSHQSQHGFAYHAGRVQEHG